MNRTTVFLERLGLGSNDRLGLRPPVTVIPSLTGLCMSGSHMDWL